MEEIVDQEKTKGKGTPAEQTKAEAESVKPKEETQYPEVEIGEEKVPFEDLKKGYMKGKDYTQKTQELAEESKKLERFREMSKYIDDPANKEKADKILAIVRGEEAKLPPEEEMEDPQIAALREELKKTKEMVAEVKRGTSEKELEAIQKDIDRETREVKAKYKDLTDEDIDRIVDLATARGGANLVEIADKYAESLKTRDKQTIKTYLEGKEKDKSKFLESGSLPPPSPDRKLSLEDGSARRAFEKTLKEATKE